MNNPILAQSLEQLADQLDTLAELVKSQNLRDKQEPVKQFSVIASRLQALSQSEILNPKDWKSKYKRGFLRKWLLTRGLAAADAVESLKGDHFLFNTTEYLAENFNFLEDFYSRLKYGQSQHRNFQFRAAKSSLPYIKAWAQMLKKLRYIDHWEEQPEGFFVDISKLSSATFFINGIWLEILLRGRVAEYLKGHFDTITEFDVLSQVNIAKPDGSVSELDLLLMLNGRVYWFECKAGDIGRYYSVFNEHRVLLRLNEERAIVLLPYTNAQMIANFKKKSGMRTFFAVHLEDQLTQLFIE